MAAVNAVKIVQSVKSAVKPADTTVSAKAKTKPADTTVSVKNETKAVTIETVMDENKDTFTNIPTTDGMFSCGNPNLMMGEENMDAEEEISENDVTYSESSDFRL